MASMAQEKNNNGLLLPNGKSTTINEIADLFKEQHKTLTPVSGTILQKVKPNSTFGFRVEWKFNDYCTESSTSITKYYCANLQPSGKIDQVFGIPDQISTGNELFSLTSPSGKRSFYLKKSLKETKPNSSGHLIEIWENGLLLQTIDVDAQQSHGELYLHPKLGKIAFSPSEDAIAFVAEQTFKTKSYFKEASQVKLLNETSKEDEKQNKSEKNNEGQGDAYEFRQDWGERLDDLTNSVICVLQIKPEIKLIVHLLEKLVPSQLFWIDEEQIGFVGYPELSRKLGINLCNNRSSYLCKINWRESDQTPTYIYGKDKPRQILYPTTNHSRTKLLFIENEPCGPHLQASKLMLLDFKTQEIETLFDYDEPKQVLPALFIITMNPACWSANDSFILFSTYSHSQNVICSFDLTSKKLHILPQPLGESNILDFKDNILLTYGSSPNHLPSVYISVLQSADACPEYVPIESMESKKLVDISFEYLKFKKESRLEQIDSIVIGPADTFNKATAAIIWPHGGPHGTSIIAYSKNIAFFVRMGFKVVLINYRGSLGIDNEYAYQLCGRIGDHDVKDVMFVVQSLIEKQLIDASKVTLYGASHGGFLITHIIGQYPDFGWRSCVAINPVTDLSKMFIITDIPDWCLVEAIGCNPANYRKLDPSLVDTDLSLFDTLNRVINIGPSEVMRVMYEKSPIAHIEKVKTPVLMLLGKIDRRVPHSQGLAYVYALRNRNVPVKCHMYQDRHDLGKPPHTGDYAVNAAKWIVEHLSD